MLIAANLEVGRQVVIGVTVAVGALDPDLLAAELLKRRPKSVRFHSRSKPMAGSAGVIAGCRGGFILR